MEKYFETATLNEVFDKMTLMFKDKTSIIFEDRHITYNELRLDTYNLAIKLRNMGIGKDDKVALLLPNCYEYLCLYFANFLIGSNVVPINSRTIKQELKNILNDADVKLIVFQDIIGTLNYLEIIKEIKSELPKIETYVLRGESSDDSMILFNNLFEHQDDLEDKISKFEKISIKEDDVALLAYTSGTTSSPKGVMITHGGLVNTSYLGGVLWGVTYDKVPEGYTALSVAPLYGAQGFLAVLIDLVCGITMHWLSTFNPNEVIKAISKGANAFHTQPTMWSLLLSSPLMNFADFSKLSTTVVSGSTCLHSLAKQITEKTGTILLNAYGLIEATGIVTVSRPEDSEEIRLNTVGSPIPGVEVKIVDSNRNEVPRGEIGEIATRGYLMRGYYKNEKKTKEVIDEEGWLYTGDAGCFYKDTDNIQVVGRVREMIIRGGFNVFPVDIEEQLLNQEKVQDVAVVGRKDNILGEAIVAFIVPKPGVNLTKGEIIKYCTNVLSSHKIPDEVYFLRQLPTILNGKIKKRLLEEWASNEIPKDEVYVF